MLEGWRNKKGGYKVIYVSSAISHNRKSIELSKMVKQEIVYVGYLVLRVGIFKKGRNRMGDCCFPL